MFVQSAKMLLSIALVNMKSSHPIVKKKEKENVKSSGFKCLKSVTVQVKTKKPNSCKNNQIIFSDTNILPCHMCRALLRKEIFQTSVLGEFFGPPTPE